MRSPCTNCESLLDTVSQVRNTGRSVVGVDLEEKIQQSVSLASPSGPLPDRPSVLYRAGFWRLGVILARLLPLKGLQTVAQSFASLYSRVIPVRREVVIQNV